MNDRIDARNLAFAYARNPNIRTVHVPSKRHRQWRDLFYGYRGAVKDSVRCSNRLWAFCSGHGLKLPKKSFKRKISAIRADVEAHGWTDEECFHLESLIYAYECSLEIKERYLKRIELTVANNADMTRLTRILGVRFIIAFALVAFIEDIQRFENPKNLVSYIGLNPSVNESGKSQGRRRMSRLGRTDLKSLMMEAAQIVMRSGGNQTAKWARHKLAGGKAYNLVVCALARKLTTFAWHILMGHPVPHKSDEKSFRIKLAKLASSIGREHLQKLSFDKPKDYIEHTCRTLFPDAT